jgi:shikimate kinase
MNSISHNFFLVGLMGCGKTFLGQQLALQNNIDFIDLDQSIEALLGMSVSDVFATKGDHFFRQTETAILQQITPQNKTSIIATGGGTACYHNNMAWMNSNGITIWLNDSIENIVERIKQDKQQRPLLKTIANEGLHKFFTHQLQERIPFYCQSKFCLSAQEITLTNLQKIIQQYV